MNQLGKNLKLSCIACLFLGMAALIAGIASGVMQAFDTDAIATLACGIGAMPAGAQASRLANVPSNAKKVRLMSLIVLIASSAFCAIAVALGNPTPWQIAALALVIVASLAMLIYSHRLVKQLERV